MSEQRISKQLKIRGQPISYLDEGPKDAPIILFIHGNSSRKETFDVAFNSNEFRSHRLIALDLFGHGDSSRDTSPNARGIEFGKSKLKYSISYHAETVREFMNELGLAMAPLIVGHSLGGHIAVRFAGLNENAPKPALRGLVTFQSPPLETTADLATGFVPSNALGALLSGPTDSTQVADLMRTFFPHAFSADASLAEKARMESVQNTFFKTDLLCRANLGVDFEQNPYMGEVSIMRRLQVPLAIFLGMRDGLIDTKLLSEFRAPCLWTERPVAFERSAHFPQYDETQKWLDTLLEFDSIC